MSAARTKPYETVWVPAHPANQVRATPDGARLAADLESACTTLARRGLVVIAVTPVLVGEGNMALGFGYSLTSGVIVTARREAPARVDTARSDERLVGAGSFPAPA